jgi:hypothetical protein
MSTATTQLDMGLHEGLPADVYHADPAPSPSLSSSILRTILGKSIEHAALEHSRLGAVAHESTASMDLGSTVHALLSGEDSGLVLGNFDNYRTADARRWRESILAMGKTPVLERDLEDAKPIAAAVRAKAALGCTNDPFKLPGKSELSAFWKEESVYCRARFDRLVVDHSAYADIWDWKTTTDVSPECIRRTICKYGYHIQAAFYLRGLNALLPSHQGRTSFIFVFVETTAPYAVRRVTLSPAFLAKGAKDVNRGLAIWKDALATSNFTAPNLDTLEVELPAFLEDDDEISVS